MVPFLRNSLLCRLRQTYPPRSDLPMWTGKHSYLSGVIRMMFLCLLKRAGLSFLWTKLAIVQALWEEKKESTVEALGCVMRWESVYVARREEQAEQSSGSSVSTLLSSGLQSGHQWKTDVSLQVAAAYHPEGGRANLLRVLRGSDVALHRSYLPFSPSLGSAWELTVALCLNPSPPSLFLSGQVLQHYSFWLSSTLTSFFFSISILDAFFFLIFSQSFLCPQFFLHNFSLDSKLKRYWEFSHLKSPLDITVEFWYLKLLSFSSSHIQETMKGLFIVDWHPWS